MSLEDKNKPDSLFNTPNPEKLKEQAKKDPILEKYPDPDKEIDSSDEPTAEEYYHTESYFEDEEARALSSSPIINANISAG